MTQTDQQNVPELRFPEFEEAWETKSLGDFFTFKNGVNADKSAYGKGRKFINVLDIITDKPITSDSIIGSVDISDKEFAKNEVRYGDILFQRSSETREEVGQSNVYLDQETTATFGGFVIRGRPITEIVPEYFHSLLKTSRVRKDMTARSGGSTRYNVGQESLSVVPVTLAPTLPEQRRIAGFLGAIDMKIAQLVEKKRLLEDYKKGCMQQLFSQKTRFKDDTGNDFPDWEDKRLGEVFSWINTNSLSRERLTYDGGYVQNIHYGDIHTKFAANFHQEVEPVPYIKDATSTDFKEDQFCKVGDVVIADASEDYTDIGKAVEIVSLSKLPLVAGLHTYIARPKPGKVQTGFAGYLLRSAPMRRQIMRIAQGISVLGISKGNLEKLTFFLPHPDEQRKIADFLSALDSKIHLISQELTHARSFKQGLLQQMFV